MSDSMKKMAILNAELAALRTELGVEELPFRRPAIEDSVFFQLIAEEGTDLISVHDPEGKYLYISPNAEQFFGWCPEELLWQNAYTFFHPEDISRIIEDHAAQDGEQQKIRYRIRKKDGTYQWVDTRSRSRLSSNEVKQIVCLTSNCDAEVRSKKALEIASEILRRQERQSVATNLLQFLQHEINSSMSESSLSSLAP